MTIFFEPEQLICPCCGRYISEDEAEIYDDYCEQCFDALEERTAVRIIQEFINETIQ